MNKTAIYGLLLALLLPLVGYFVVRSYSKDVTPMPPRYFHDSVVTRTVNGKQVEDTVWHQLPDLQFTNQLGQQVRLSDLAGKVLVIDFFFTHCPSICPTMTTNMKRLQDGISSGKRVGDQQPEFMHLLSISIDPDRDSVERLKGWADRFGVDPGKWWLLTGNHDSIYNFCLNEVKLGLVDGGTVDTSFIHSPRFVLVDKDRVIRGYYDGMDTASVGKLSRDIILVSLEKDKHRKSPFAGQLETLALLVFAVIGGLIALSYFLRKDKKQHGVSDSKK